MTAQDTFDRRLGEALLAYAADAAIEPDPLAFAAGVAAAHPRSRFAVIAVSLRRTRLRTLWVAVALLLLAGVVGAALVGMRPTEDPSHLVVRPQVPEGLFGRWRLAGKPGPYLDLNAASLLHEADGRPLDSLGSVVSFLPERPGATEGTVVIHSSLPCGDGSYRLVFVDPPSPGPTAAPAPSSSQQAPPSLISGFRFVDHADSCPARQSILRYGRWERVMLRLTGGGTYDSLDFGEPFHLILPPDVGLSLPNAEAGTMYETHPGQLRISHPYWGGAFIDDVPVNRVLCRPDLGTLPDIPASVDEVGAWLASATEVRFIRQTELVVDGRRALRFEQVGDCGTEGESAVSDLVGGYRYYAIPTRDDVILFGVYGDTANEYAVAERIMLALHFD